jgi:hypothetical protein
LTLAPHGRECPNRAIEAPRGTITHEPLDD